MKPGPMLMTTLLLGACATGPEPVAITTRAVPTLPAAGLAAVLGKDAATLTRLFGQPNAEASEGPGRKLQYSSAICVLDAYLYPKGNAAPVVTYVDARQTDGSPIDRASCVAALQRRSGGK